MFLGLFHDLRSERVPVTPREWLDLLGALQAGLAQGDPEALYALARTALVKDERYFDRFDRAFARFVQGTAAATAAGTDLDAVISEDWLRQALGREPTDGEKAEVRSLGSLQALMEQFRQRLAEQRERHQGGNRWIGTGGTSPFGAGGFHPGGIRIGPHGGGRMAAKVWEQRHFRELDGNAELSPRNLKMALRRLRRFAREGVPDELDLEGTIAATAREGGLLDLRMRPERRNTVSVMLLLDIGGSMDGHVHAAEALFGAARAEFKRLEHYYFHNFVYDHVWKHDRRREGDRIPTGELLRRHPPGHRVVVVGDAAMHPYEITEPGGSAEYWNEEAGAVWFRRLTTHFPRMAWINPVPRDAWDHTASNRLVRELMDGRMFPLTPDGVGEAMGALGK